MATKKKTTKLANLIIVDASGSMGDKVDEVKGGLKQLIEQISTDAKKDKKTTLSTTIITDFSSSSDFNILVQSKDSLDLDPSLADNYRPRAATALYDAIAKTFSLLKDKHDSVFVNIITDGYENDSKEMNRETLKALIESKKKENWVITFMCTTEQAMYDAQSLGISIGNTMTFANSAKGVKKSLSKLSKVRSAHYSATMDMANTDWMEQEKLRESMQTIVKDTEDGDE